MSRGLSLFAALLMLVALASAQEINIAIGLGGRPARSHDLRRDRRRARAARVPGIVGCGGAAHAIDLAIRFVEQYPRSIVLREAYELAARAYIAEGDLASGLHVGAARARLMPENPFLLVMPRHTAAKQRDLDLAVDERARRAAIPRSMPNAHRTFRTQAMATGALMGCEPLPCSCKAGWRRCADSTRMPNSRCSPH